MIRTQSGLSLVVNNQPFTIDSTHINYNDIVDAIREGRWNDVPDLVSITKSLQIHLAKPETNVLGLRVANDRLYYNNEGVEGVIADRILAMRADGFDLRSMDLFLGNLYQNPSNKAIKQLYSWMEKNGITISEDGHLLAYKRVCDDYTSFHDGVTKNNVGLIVELPRNKCDDRSEVTCSTGLHFCSQAYLPHYSGGAGRVLLLKINPRDVVSIPTDYNNAKGRACKYLVLTELRNDARATIEVKPVLTQPVILEERTEEVAEVGDSFKAGYADGYKDGRGKKAYGTSANGNFLNAVEAETRNKYTEGYQAGRVDGRNKAPKAY
jgi:hypothetical protein